MLFGVGSESRSATQSINKHRRAGSRVGADSLAARQRQRSLPSTFTKTSTLRNDSAYLAYIITTRRMTPGELLKYRNGLPMPEACHGQRRCQHLVRRSLLARISRTPNRTSHGIDAPHPRATSARFCFHPIVVRSDFRRVRLASGAEPRKYSRLAEAQPKQLVGIRREFRVQRFVADRGA